MLVDLVFAELHSPLFHGGKNHGTKLKCGPDLKLQWSGSDRDWETKWEG